MSKEIGAWQRQRAKIAELRKEKALVEAGLLKIQTSGSEMLYSLTKDGLIQVLKDRIRLEPMELPNGERCYVIFDVPEDVKKTRNAFRRFLKKAGFKQIQLSVWATHKDVVDDLQQLITALKIGKWAKVIVGESLEAKTATIDQ